MTCGDTVTGWVPLLGSTWNLTANFDDAHGGTALAGTLIALHVGALAVTTVVEPSTLSTGTWAHNVDAQSLTWTAEILASEGDTYTMVGNAQTCDTSGKVLTALGSLKLNGTRVGSVALSRVT